MRALVICALLVGACPDARGAPDVRYAALVPPVKPIPPRVPKWRWMRVVVGKMATAPPEVPRRRIPPKVRRIFAVVEGGVGIVVNVFGIILRIGLMPLAQ